MKRNLYLLPLVATAILASCDSAEVSPRQSSITSNNGMNARLDETDWKALSEHTRAASRAGVATIVGTQFVGSSYSKQITLQVKDFTKVGTYTTDQVEANVTINNLTGRSSQSWSTDGEGTAASVTVTAYDEKTSSISGTFSFIAKGTTGTEYKKVTMGVFTDVKIQK